MGLIDLKTNLRSLSYGSGRGEPYITRNLPAYDEDPGNPYLGTDMFGRSGQIRRGLTDTVRLTRYLTNGKGLLFNAKQIALEKTRPKVPYGPKRSFLFSTVLAQAGVQGTGVHFDRTNNLDVAYEDKYDYQTRTFYDSWYNNRLAILYDTKIAKTNNQFDLSPFGLTGKSDQTTLISYEGGPGSLGGIGKTTIKRTTNTSEYKPDQGKNQSVFTLTNDQLGLKERSSSTGFVKGITNFVLELPTSTTNAKRVLGRLTNYAEFNRQKTFGTGDPGNNANLNRQTYYEGYPVETEGTDRINVKKVYSSNSGVNFSKSSEDFIKFYIAVIDNDNPQNKTYIHFRAYVSGISDNYSANWNSINYPGRGEEFFKYGGFTRDIGFSFQVHVGSRAELFPTYQKLNYLASIMAPDYSSPGFMRGNIVQLTVGDYINDTYGIITGFSYNIPEDATWDIARNNDGTEDKNSAELPMLINVDSFNFKPIHNFVPRTVKDLDLPESKFITLGSDYKGYKPTPAPTPMTSRRPNSPTPTLQT